MLMRLSDTGSGWFGPAFFAFMYLEEWMVAIRDEYFGTSRRRLSATESNDLFNHDLLRSEAFNILNNNVLYRSIMETTAFSRLNAISFLGAIDYLIHPNGVPHNKRHTRYQHSVGVACLAIIYGKWLGLSEDEERHTVVAALLHDIGHAPLSHSIESIFREYFGIDHHLATKEIILGRHKLGAGLKKIFNENRIDADRVLNLLDGSSEEKMNDIFYSIFNIDTMEGITRSYSYISGCYVVNPVSVLWASLNRCATGSRDILDKFWNLKDSVYQYIINGRAGRLADALAQVYTRKNIVNFRENYFFFSEETLRRYHKELFHLLRGARRPYELRNSLQEDADFFGTIIFSYDRRFVIHNPAKSADLDQERDRYRQEKLKVSLQFDDLLPKNSEASKNWLQIEMEITNDESYRGRRKF